MTKSSLDVFRNLERSGLLVKQGRNGEQRLTKSNWLGNSLVKRPKQHYSQSLIYGSRCKKPSSGCPDKFSYGKRARNLRLIVKHPAIGKIQALIKLATYD